jgi:hypothetical protein
LVPMFGVLTARFREAFSPVLVSVLTTLMFALAVYSFLYVGLQNIPKIAGC